MNIIFDYKKSSRKMLIRTDTPELFTLIRDQFSEEKEGSEFAKRKNKHVPTRKFVITPTGRCQPGLFWEIRKYIRDNIKGVTISTTPELKAALVPSDGTKFEKDLGLSFNLRDYQEKAVENAIRLGRGTIKLATGGGKTFITAHIIENFFKSIGSSKNWRCLVIVPDLGLVNQTYDEIVDSNVTFSCSKWTGSNELDESSNVVICNSGIIQSRHKDHVWINLVDLLIVDEAHKVRDGNKIGKIIDDIKTQRRYALTGTLPEKQADVWNIIGKFGPIIYEKSSSELRDEGVLTEAHISILDLHYKDVPPKIPGKNRWRSELVFIAGSPFRNKVIKHLCGKLKGNTLILVNTIKHGEMLESILGSLLNKKVYYIRGEVDVEERDRIKQIIEDNDDVVVVAITKIFSTGINIKNLHNIIFASGGKSFITIVQAIGRGLRKHESKSLLNIIDIADNLDCGREHSIKRCSIYDSEKFTYTIKDVRET